MADESIQHFLANDKQLIESPPNVSKYGVLPDAATIETTVAALTKKGWNVTLVKTKAEALAALATFADVEKSYFAAGSTSLSQAGWTEWLKDHPSAFKRNIKEESIKARMAHDYPLAFSLAAEGANADIYMSSIVAATTGGEVLVSDGTGTRVCGFLTAKKLVVLASANKIVSTLTEAFERLNEYALPLESARVRVAYSMPGSAVTYSLVISGANPFAPPGTKHMVLVTEDTVGY